jgi:hypothetical protein
MFARSVSALLAGLLLTAPPAEAKLWNFETGSPLGLGLLVGISQNPDSDFVEKPQNTSASFSHFFGFEPYVDFGNFIIRLSGQLHSYPIFSGRGTASQGAFTETSDVGSVVFGAHLLLLPYVSETKLSRGFIKLGFSQGIARGENVRTFASGPIYEEKFESRTRELLFGLGYEFFLVQNYSLQIESGFRQAEYEKAEYLGGKDLNGVAKTKGDPLLNTNGGNKKFNSGGAYFSVGLNLNF